MDGIETNPAESAEGGTSVPDVSGVDDAKTEAPATLRAQIERAFERDEKGRFSAATTGKQISDQAAVSGVKAEAKLAPIPLPKSWSADQKARFDALPRELQEYLAKRESDRESFLGQKSARAARYDRWEPVEQQLSQYAPTLRAMGIDPINAIPQLLNAQIELARDPARALAKIAQSYGIKLGQIQQPQGGFDPSIRALIQQELAPIRETFQQQQAAQTERQIQSNLSEVNKFAEGKEHWEKVSPRMVGLIPAIQAEFPNLSNSEVLDRAYAAAVALTPEIANIEAQKAEAKRIEDAKAKANQARKAGASISSANQSQSTSYRPGQSLRDTLEAAWEGKI